MTVYHISGFTGDDVREVKLSIQEGKLHEIANGIFDTIESQGYEVKRSTLRTLDGYLVEARATVQTSETQTMWHVLTESLDSPWPTAPLSTERTDQ